MLGDFHLLHLLTQGGTVSVGNWSISGPSSCFRFSFKNHRGSYSFEGDSEDRALSIPGTVFTGDTDLWETLLAGKFQRIKREFEMLASSGWETYSWCAWSSCLSAAVGLKMSSEEIEKSLWKDWLWVGSLRASGLGVVWSPDCGRSRVM